MGLRRLQEHREGDLRVRAHICKFNTPKKSWTAGNAYNKLQDTSET